MKQKKDADEAAGYKPGARHRGVLVSLLIYALVSASLLVFVYTRADDRDRWASAQTIALLFAGYIYLWYSWETLYLRRAAERQIELSQEQTRETVALRHVAEKQINIARAQLSAMMRPLVIASPSEMGVFLSNIGVGPALNVVISPIVNTAESESTPGSEYRIGPAVTALAKGEAKEVEAAYYIGGKEMTRGASVFDPRHIIKNHSLVIEYFTVDNVRCTTEMEMSRAGYWVIRVQIDDSSTPLAG